MTIVKIFIIIISIIIIIYTPKARKFWDKHMFMWGYDSEETSKIANFIRDTINRIIFIIVLIATLLDLIGIVNIYPI